MIGGPFDPLKPVRNPLGIRSDPFKTCSELGVSGFWNALGGRRYMFPLRSFCVVGALDERILRICGISHLCVVARSW